MAKRLLCPAVGFGIDPVLIYELPCELVCDRFLFVPEVRPFARDECRDQVVWQPRKPADRAVRVQLVFGVPCPSDRKDDDLMNPWRQRPSGPVGVEHLDLSGSQSWAEQQRVQRAEKAPVGCDDFKSGRVGPGSEARDQAFVEAALCLVHIVRFEGRKPAAHLYSGCTSLPRSRSPRCTAPARSASSVSDSQSRTTPFTSIEAPGWECEPADSAAVNVRSVPRSPSAAASRSA